MKPLFVLIISFLLSSIVIKLLTKKLKWQFAGRIAMAFMLLFTAMGHFIFTDGMSSMVPDIFPMKKEIVYGTGIFEIIIAVCLLIPRFQIIIGWILILFFVLILPANIKSSIDSLNYQTGELNGLGVDYLWFRIPLQLFFIVWVYFTTIKKSLFEQI